MKKYSAFSLLRNALSYNRKWTEAWRSPQPQRKYDVLIVGGGGHGLATAYYLAKEHGVRNIAVLEKGWIGGGNTGAIRRSCAPITCGPRHHCCMRNRSNSGKA